MNIVSFSPKKVISNECPRGVGLEGEGFFLTKEGKPVPTVLHEGCEIPTSQYVLGSIATHAPGLLSLVSLELVSVQFEVKTNVHADLPSAQDALLQLHAIVNQIVEEKGIVFRFEPVLKERVKLLPSIERTSSLLTQTSKERIYAVLDFFGMGTENEELLYDSTISSLQINDSRVFGNLDRIEDPNIREKASLELLFYFYNTIGKEIRTLLSSTQEEKKNTLFFHKENCDFRGKSRLKCYDNLQSHVKEKRFQDMGLPGGSEIFLPQEFSSIIQMKRYMAAQRGIVDFQNGLGKSKDDHGFIKYKNEIQTVEARFIDATNTPKQMTAILKEYEKLIVRIVEKFHEHKARDLKIERIDFLQSEIV